MEDNGEDIEYRRASQHCICNDCGKPYGKHPPAMEKELLNWMGEPFLKRLCDGRLVKL